VVGGGRGLLEDDGGTVYLAMSLRNVGLGIAVIQGWRVEPDPSMREMTRPEPDLFRPQSRDLYVPAGDVSFWQAAMRNGEDADCPEVMGAIYDRRTLLIERMTPEERDSFLAIASGFYHGERQVEVELPTFMLGASEEEKIYITSQIEELLVTQLTRKLNDVGIDLPADLLQMVEIQPVAAGG
ncbi:MAG TPA: hypothetical protein VF942_01130, partial [Acidimicrobiales bacterium]